MCFGGAALSSVLVLALLELQEKRAVEKSFIIIVLCFLVVQDGRICVLSGSGTGFAKSWVVVAATMTMMVNMQ